MTDILYEHPLNERFRNYLKIEQYFAQLDSCNVDAMIHQYHYFFSSLFTLIDIIERNDIRGDLIKDLEKLEQSLVLWSRSPDINSDALTDTLKQVVGLLCQLKNHSPAWLELKEDKLLNCVKQRFAVPGGSSIFDIPQLKFWVHQETTTLQKDMSNWLVSLDNIRKSLNLILKFIRLRSGFETVEADNGFYQDSDDNLVLLRIKIHHQADYYPSVSGNKFQYSIRFMHTCHDSGRRYTNTTTHFKLAKC